MKKMKTYGLSLALALLLLLTMAPAAQAADMTEGSGYAIGHLYPGPCRVWAYGYYLNYYGTPKVYGTMMIKDHEWYANYIDFGVIIRYPNGTAAASDHYFSYLRDGITVGTSLLNPPSGGYVDFGAATYYHYFDQAGKEWFWLLGGDDYTWYYP